jgi:ElaB/YqjD/DUF883 family membrane-anchored ribosome-binding protein
MDQERMAAAAGEATDKAKTAVQQGIEQTKARLPDLETATATVKDLAEQARSGAVRASAALQDAARQAGTQVNDAATTLYQQGSRAGNYLRERTNEQPLAALLIAGAIGYLLAVAIRRRW